MGKQINRPSAQVLRCFGRARKIYDLVGRTRVLRHDFEAMQEKKKSPNNPEAPPIEERRRVCGNQRPLADTLSSRTPKPKESSSIDGSFGPSSRTAGLHMFPCLRQLPLELKDLVLPLAETTTLLEMIPLPRVQVF